MISLVVLFLLALVTTSNLYATEGPLKSRKVLLNEPCQIQPLSNWTEQEKWVWEQVCLGEIANFNEAKGYGGSLDPMNPDGWLEKRILRLEFLKTILLHEPYRSSLTHQGVRIEGAWFKEPIDLANAEIFHPLLLKNSRFEADIDLSRAKTPHLISLEGSKCTGKLEMDSIEVESSLFMSGSAEFAEVVLHGAKIGGQIGMSGSKFTGELAMYSIEVGKGLFMSSGAEFAEMVLVGAKIGGQIDMSGSKFTGELVMDSIDVESSLYMRGGAEFAEVVLVGTKIGGQIDMSSSKFIGKLDMQSIDVRSSVFMSESTFEKQVDFFFSTIGQNLDITDSTFSSLDLTGTQIIGELRLGSGIEKPTQWDEGAKLTLRNTEVGVLQDLPEAWPENLELNGFVYNSLGGFGAEMEEDIAARETSWFMEWLGKQKRYSPQPYEQLASILQKAGYKDKATEILYASRERERNEIAKGLKWLGLTLLKWIIGYGYSIFRSIIWVAAFIVAGMVIIRINKEGKNRGTVWCLFYSLDILLPIIRLDERHYEIKLDGFARYYFYFHILIGFILASFVAAGISGLTK